MNENEIYAAYVSKPRQLKKINGVMTPVYLKPFDKQYNFTRRFIKFNQTLLKQGLTDIILYDDRIVYNRDKNTFEKKSKYFKKKRFNTGPQDRLRFSGNSVFTNPVLTGLNNEGNLYTYLSSFRQQPGQAFHSPVFRYKQILKQYLGQRILIKATGPSGWSRETILDIPLNLGDFKRWFETGKEYNFIQVESGIYVFDGDINDEELPENQARMRIFNVNAVNPARYDQAFAQNNFKHCVLGPVRNYFEERIECAKSETSTIKKYKAGLNKISRWDLEYPVGVGIPIDKLNDLCVNTNIQLDLYLPGGHTNKREWRTYKGPKKPIKIFKFMNTRFNHLDIISQFKNNIEEITQEEYKSIMSELYNNNIYHVFNNSNIYTLDTTYSVPSKYNEIVNEFEKKNNLSHYRIDDSNPHHKLLSEFVKHSCIFNGCVDFKPTFMYRTPYIHGYTDYSKLEDYYGVEKLPELLEKKDYFTKRVLQKVKQDKIKQIDMSKAYTRCKDCEYFEGYLGNITDLRITNTIRGAGLYVIKNIKNLPQYIQMLGVYFENNIYPSPELKYLQSLGVEFDIVAGCWGTTIDIDWGDEKDEDGNYIGMYEKSNNVRHYAKWFGCAIKTTPYTTYSYKTDNLDYINNWEYVESNKDDATSLWYHDFVEDDKKVMVVHQNIPKHNIFHQTQIASFIYGYMRISMIQQLSKIPPQNIIRVCVDGIYYHDCDFEILPLFQEDKTIKFGNEAGDTYRTKNKQWTDFSEFGDDKEFHKREVWTGPGGCGKTHRNIIDKGNCGVLYIAHSWKLASAKREEFKQLGIDLNVSVVARLIMDDWFRDGKPENYWEDLSKKYNTIIIDEISTLSNTDKIKLEKRFHNHKLIYCGDLGYNDYEKKPVCYQCEPISGDGSKAPLFQFNDKDYRHYPLKINRRTQDKKLLKLLNHLRGIIYWGHRSGAEVVPYIKRLFDIKDKNTIDYKREDMILSRRHVSNEFYDKKYADLEKYNIIMESNTPITTADGFQGLITYRKGQILLDKPPDAHKAKYRIRHGYTIDCIQGETATHNLFIDCNHLVSWNHLYTAVSRAKTLKQIQFIM
jgi:hypothetical protein